MSNESLTPPPQRVPTLTEVIDLPGAASTAEVAIAATTAVAEQPLADLPSENELTRQVLSEVQRQIDLMLDFRVREALAPVLARVADGLVRDARNELASTLRDVVARAVAQELSRHRTR
jgi:hypothetical protein